MIGETSKVCCIPLQHLRELRKPRVTGRPSGMPFRGSNPSAACAEKKKKRFGQPG